MLSAVFDVLRTQRWFDASQPFDSSVHLTQGACVWLLLSRGGVGHTYVKFSDRVSLQAEATRYAAANAHYPALVPAFIGHVHTGGLDVLACRAVDFRGVDRAVLLGAAAGAAQTVQADLAGYFNGLRTASAPAGVSAVRNADLLAALQRYYAGHALAPLAQRWLKTGAALRAAALPDQAQHGDLALNNLGRTLSGRLVIFDWEDFGAVSLPGLDLFTLELSLAGGARHLLDHRAQRYTGSARLVARACAAMQLDGADYGRLTPVYALVFRYLKRNYGPAVREQMDGLLQDLAASDI